MGKAAKLAGISLIVLSTLGGAYMGRNLEEHYLGKTPDTTEQIRQQESRESQLPYILRQNSRSGKITRNILFEGVGGFFGLVSGVIILAMIAGYREDKRQSKYPIEKKAEQENTEETVYSSQYPGDGTRGDYRGNSSGLG